MIDHEVGVITHLYSEPSSMFGCFAYLKDSLNAVLPSLRLVRLINLSHGLIHFVGVSYLQKVFLDFKGSVYVQCSMGQF